MAEGRCGPGFSIITAKMPLPVFNLLLFAFTGWLGLYLIARDTRKPLLVYSGLGLVAYASVIALTTLHHTSSTPFIFQAIYDTLLFTPSICWFGATLYLLPEAANTRQIRFVAPVLLIMIFVIVAASPPSTESSSLPKGVYSILGIGVSVLLLITVGVVGYRVREERRNRLGIMLFTLTLFFGLGVAMLLLPIDIIPFDTALVIVGIDLALLDICIAGLDAFDEGETLLPDAAYSFVRAILIALVFGGQVVLAAAGQFNGPMLTLLFGVVGAAIASQVFAEGIQGLLDRLLFARLPHIQQARAELRRAASALPRTDERIDPMTLRDDELVRLTRRALSHMNNPGKLAASPLMRLPMLDTRTTSDHTLERTAALKLLLTESINRLKPTTPVDYGTSEEWRFYNALYFPYVLGIKLQSYNPTDELPDEARRVVTWFRTHVPERTLHNWQNAAARLVAQDLRDQMQ